MAKKSKFIQESEKITWISWAIVCQLKSYQLAYHINERCEWNLIRLKNLLSNEESKTIGFALYNYQKDLMQPDFYLIALKEDRNVLVKGLKQFDYLIQARLPDEDTQWDSSALMQRIKSIEHLQGVFEIDMDRIKNTNVLYFDKQLDKLDLENED